VVVGQWDLTGIHCGTVRTAQSETTNATRIGHLRLAILYCALPAVTAYAGSHTFGLVVVDGAHLDEIFELEFDQARGLAVITGATGSSLA
jgi:hypothetical protein